MHILEIKETTTLTPEEEAEAEQLRRLFANLAKRARIAGRGDVVLQLDRLAALPDLEAQHEQALVILQDLEGSSMARTDTGEQQ